MSERKLRILHVGHAPLPSGYPFDPRFGWHPARWVLNHAVAQRKYANIDAEILVQVPGGDKALTLELMGVPIHYLPAPIKFRAATLFWPDRLRLARRIRELAPDVVHAHGTEEANALAAQHSGLPCVITGQGIIFAINREIPPRLFSRQRIQEFTEHLAFRRARHVVAKTHYIKKLLAERFPHLEISYIPNTFDERLLQIQQERIAAQFLFCGAVTPRKGLHIIRQALEILAEQDLHTNIRLLVAGNTNPDSASAYERGELTKLRELLGSRLILLGTISQVELANHVSASMALLAPSLEDSLGNAAVEAVLLGTHALVSSGTGMAEFLAPFGNNTALPVSEPQRWADAIAHASENFDPKSADEARQKLIAETGPRQAAHSHEKLYRKVLADFAHR